MATRSSGPRRRPAPPHVQAKMRQLQAREASRSARSVAAKRNRKR